MAVYGWGAYACDKNTCAKTLAENVEGRGYMWRGAYMWDTMGKEGYEELRDWMAIFVQLLDMGIVATLQEKRWLRLEYRFMERLFP